MTLKALNESIARAWLDAFNAHDVRRLVGLYAAECTHTSPRIRQANLGEGGQLRGHAALTDWWQSALQKTPSLRYEATAITANEERVVLEYLRHATGEAATPVAEAFDVKHGKIVASRVFLG